MDVGGRPSVDFQSKLHSRLQFDQHAFEIETEGLCQALRTPSPRKILICEDLQPAGAQYLGAFLSLQPFVLEYYINRDVSFESQTVQAHVFDYPETYHSGKLPRVESEQDFLRLPDHARPCTLLRMWRDVYALFQRVVWVVVFNKESNTYVHLILLDSLRSPKDRSTFQVVSSLPSFESWKVHGDWPAEALPQKTFRNQLEKALLGSRVANQANIGPDNPELEINATPEIRQAITSLLCAKWRLMIRRAQESISESHAPLAGDLDDITEVLQRKHDFEKLKRTLSALIASVKRIPGVQQSSPDLVELMSFESSLESWAMQLEKVSQSLLGLLAVSESKRATQQAVRSKNLQLLAFIFIPISTVSSIYGMNTVEILGRPPQNWNFIVGAFIAIALSGLAATIYDSQIMTRTLDRLWESLHLNHIGHASPTTRKTSQTGRRTRGRLSSDRGNPKRKPHKSQCLVM
ncbi:hypothetical protein A1O7_04139 [Cladophialophora yegresii CBS 114405]|uniref:Uncharacterized protein n=1 Tax=Cladophialophora yegresii CBS 114405 TaxID=1182544 RepID=W9W638_9EURO|nr:uncharacterized protein A1O7_04139 [Cladophialophora yegresii CBS 114405]EXJ59991.1 hypothetical protein A1O7_04139 [Cladophialophora yegresii CBS 114405]